MPELNFVLAQINLTVGAIDANVDKIIEHCQVARERHRADVVVFPELAVCGYPAEDLLLRADFLRRCDEGMARLRRASIGVAVIVGHPLCEGGRVFNALSVLCDGRTKAVYKKRCLPNYAVFDEKRYFSEGDAPQVVDIGGVCVGLTVCEDIWSDAPVTDTVACGARVIVAINASPFHNEQAFVREQRIVAKQARRVGVPMIYLNLVGGQDSLVFDGSSLAVDARGEVVARLPAFCETMANVRYVDGELRASAAIAPMMRGAELIYAAIVLGVRDYVDKNRFRGVVLGLSGGVDSALCLAIAVDAIGASRVTAVMMPSRYTSQMSRDDARAQADKLGVRFYTLDIEPLVCAATDKLSDALSDAPSDIAEQNIQSRCRGLLLMALSNQSGDMVLTTGNKSEMAVGYATLYGDMVGGYAAIGDVPKMMVYELARYRNARAESKSESESKSKSESESKLESKTEFEIIPTRVLTRAPSAELADGQTDQDTLPPYAVLDEILAAFVERDESPAQIIARGVDEATVNRVVEMVIANEYKRRQSAPCARVTSRAFGKDRRYPMTNDFFRRG